ncbi:MAG: 50S ribosomal protein L7 [Oscillospiraceae bacterium]
MDSNLLHLIGLAKKAGQLAVGEEPVGAAARARDVRLLLVARDAAENTLRRVQHFAEAGQCIWTRVPFTKDELGGAVGRSSCAMVAVTDIGFASAVMKKLAVTDPETFGETAARLEVKAQRAAERRREQAVHEKKLGKKRREPPAAKPGTPLPHPAVQRMARKADEEQPVAVPKPRSYRKPAGETAKPFVRPGTRASRTAAKPDGGVPVTTKPGFAIKPGTKPDGTTDGAHTPRAFRASLPVKHGRGSSKKGK